MKKILVLILFFFSNSAFADFPNDFENTSIGLKLTKPTDWHFSRSNTNEIVGPAKIVTIEKNIQSGQISNSRIEISIKSDQALINNDARATLENMVANLQKVFASEQIKKTMLQTNFEVQQPAADATIGGVNAAYLRFQNSTSEVNGKISTIISQIWVVPSINYNFFIMATTNQGEAELLEIKKIIDSIVITKTPLAQKN